MILLRHPGSGEMVCVASIGGYEDWAVLEERDGPPPEHSNWVDGQGWILDQALADAQAEQARLNTLSRAEYLAEVAAKATSAAAPGAASTNA